MTANRHPALKTVDVAAAALVLAGGLSWGTLGLFGVDPIEALFGPANPLGRAVHMLIGAAALYELTQWRAIQRRWECRPWPRFAERAGA